MDKADDTTNPLDPVTEHLLQHGLPSGFRPPAYYCEIIACLAVHPALAGAMDLMLGVHPEENRQLTEMEEELGYWSVPPLDDPSIPDAISRVNALWRRHWSGWTPGSVPLRATQDVIEDRWRYLIPHCTPLALAYLFTPFGAFSPEAHEARRLRYEHTFEAVDQLGITSPRANGQPTWTTSFFPAGNLRSLFEKLCGLTGEVKSRLGIDEEHSGFLTRYVAAHDAPIDELLNPRQFEHLVAEILRANAWDCRVTRYSKDGGIDIEARRLVGGVPSVMLVQAKRNRSRRVGPKRARPVGIDEVKAFAATVCAEEKDAGILVTSSTITRDARNWAKTKGRNVAMVQFADGEDLRDRLFDISRRGSKGDIAAYVLSTKGRR